MPANRDAIILHLHKIPELPAGAVQALRTLQDPDVSLDRVAPALSHDPGLTASVLKLANSAAYAPVEPIRTVQDAVVRLGRDTVKAMVVAVAMGPGATAPVPGYGLGPGELLEHSMGVARATVHLAKRLKVPVPHAAFTAGLLHNVGKLVLGNFIAINPSQIMQLAKDDCLSFDAAERMLFGIDHAEVGALLLARWGLPEEITLPVRWHHQPNKSPGDQTSARLIHLADHCCIANGVGAGVDGESYPPDSSIVDALGYTPEIGAQVFAEVQSEVKPLKDFFKISGREVKVEIVGSSATTQVAKTGTGPGRYR